MKRSYKILLSIICIELLIVKILENSDIKFSSMLANAIGTLLFLLPIQFLLFLLSKDDRFSEKTRKLFIIIFWFINICFVSGGIALLALR